MNNISVVYSDVVQVLKGVSLSVERNRIVSLLGSNGSGKTTTLKAISGLLKPENGKVTDGTIHFGDTNIANAMPEDITRKGIIQVLEGRQPFKYLTVEENLRVGTAALRKKPGPEMLEMIYNYFPALVKRRKALAGYCSGGELQMMVIGRALMARPRLIMLDEPSMGLAPIIVQGIFGEIGRLREGGNTILLVEQNARAALRVADRGYVIETGQIVLSGTAEELLNNNDVRRAYLGKDYRSIGEGREAT